MRWIRAGFLKITLLLIGGIQLPVRAQMAMGNVGLFQVPTADMNETGTFMGGGNFLPRSLSPFGYPTGNYFVNITMFSFLELTYRQTLIRTDYMREEPKLRQQDRSISVRLRLLREGKVFPALLVGTNDPRGNSFFGSLYAVGTKNWTLGKGHRLGATLGYIHPFSMNRKSAQSYQGLLAGVAYTPKWCPNVKLIAEYDSKNVNWGATATFWKHLTLHVFGNGWKGCSAGVRYETTLFH